MPSELSLRFPDPGHVEVSFDGDASGLIPFASPLTDRDRLDLQWYLETYGGHSLDEPDDLQAREVEKKLPAWGKALFDAVFGKPEALRLFDRFRERQDGARLLTIGAEHPQVLALPWELLHDPSRGGAYLFLMTPRISIRRRLPGQTGGHRPYRPEARDVLHLLFLVSRPQGAGFLDPRADARAVLDALEEHAGGRVTSEFLRPATLDALLKRLEDRSKPPVDIVHFDGHGVFDRDGGLPKRVEKSRGRKLGPAEEVLRDSGQHGEPNTGYLLFEDAEGDFDLVSAEKLGANLTQQRVALVVLSACQSAAIGEEDESERPMGTVAARLLGSGIPSVLAMTHSVLVATTRALFGELYGELSQGKGVGESLDNARRHLANHPERHEVRRGAKRERLKLHDWFLPALYQSGEDSVLLRTPGADAPPPASVSPARSNLRREPEEGFHGRRRELWEIERWLAGKVRRVTVTGFGGQGKTALAEEAGRWLLRASLFEAAVFVDYARVQGEDALAIAVSNVGSVLGETLADAAAAETALRKTRTLVILDNLEALAAGPLRELLDAAARWSEAGGTRVLCTTRRPDLGHAEYRAEGTLRHRRLVLEGLGSVARPDDCLAWLAELWKLPPDPALRRPERDDLVELFDRVRFHPLSIRVLAQQLKTRTAHELKSRLEELLAEADTDASAAALGEDTPRALIASLRLSLDRLDAEARDVLPRLGVFQGGAFEDGLLDITGIDEGRWQLLRRQLEAAALLEAEDIPGVTVPYVRFHPTLAPMLASRLGDEERTRLTSAYRERYHALANYLYNADRTTPHQARAIAWRELPNLLHAVKGALEASDADAMGFANSVNMFLRTFGLTQEAKGLETRAEAAAAEVGSKAWYLLQRNRGERLLEEGRVSEATGVFTSVLDRLGEGPNYRRALMLVSLGRCLRAAGRPDLASQHLRVAADVLDKLPPNDEVKSLRGTCFTDLADGLRHQGKFAEAREAYEQGLKIFDELNDLRSRAVISNQLGTLAMHEGNLMEAIGRLRAAIELVQQLGEPRAEATAWHQLGNAFTRTQQWDEAERHYRESARIEQETGNVAGAAKTWTALATLNKRAGRPDAAERWDRKAIDAFRSLGDSLHLSFALSNLAELLRSRPGRLAEARQLAEEALAIKRTLDPAAAEIWNTHGILSGIAEAEAAESADGAKREALRAEAGAHRRAALEAKRAFAGTRHELKRHIPLILGTVVATTDPATRPRLEPILAAYADPSSKEMVAAIRRILAGERDEDALQEGQFGDGPMVVDTILRGLTDPATLSDLHEEAKGESGE